MEHIAIVSGAGNRFVMMGVQPDGSVRRTVPEHQSIASEAAALVASAQLLLGVAVDGVLVVAAPSDEQREGGGMAQLRIINTDGSDGGVCGNGLRCVAALCAGSSLPAGAWVAGACENVRYDVALVESVATGNAEDGGARLIERKAWTVEISLPAPQFGPSCVGLDRQHPDAEQWLAEAGMVSMGNPHAVFFGSDTPDRDEDAWTRCVESCAQSGAWSEGINASVAQRTDANSMTLRTHERGVGWTQACGSGACAAVALGVRRGDFQSGKPVRVVMPGGTLTVRWEPDAEPSSPQTAPIWLKGGALLEQWAEYDPKSGSIRVIR